MIRYLINRLITSLVVIFLVTLVTFTLFFATPNNVARTLAGKGASQAVVDSINHRLGLDKPLWWQFGHFVWRAMHGDLGHDYYHNQSVTSLIRDAAPVSFSVAIGAAVIWLILGISSGVISAVRPRSLLDRVLNVLALFFYSMPSFVLGSLFLLGVYALIKHGNNWLPSGGYVPFFGHGTLADSQHGPWQWFRHLILPWITLALLTAAAYTRFTRGSMLEVLSEDYIRTARAKGLSERRVVLRHGLRSALTPVVTQFGIDLATLAGGTVVTEQVFQLDGLGRQAVTAIRDQDLPIIIGTVLVVSALVVVMNFFVDILYSVLDPRVRLY
ncbi:ABC transporter permease [Nocardioides montaniterrae]